MVSMSDMTRHRRLYLASFAALGLVVLALPGVHWRLIGWARWEPFYQGRPSLYWRGVAMACHAESHFFDPKAPEDGWRVHFVFYPPHHPVLRWLAVRFGATGRAASRCGATRLLCRSCRTCCPISNRRCGTTR
jgi:hypothetical protein